MEECRNVFTGNGDSCAEIGFFVRISDVFFRIRDDGANEGGGFVKNVK